MVISDISGSLHNLPWQALTLIGQLQLDKRKGSQRIDLDQTSWSAERISATGEIRLTRGVSINALTRVRSLQRAAELYLAELVGQKRGLEPAIKAGGDAKNELLQRYQGRHAELVPLIELAEKDVKDLTAELVDLESVTEQHYFFPLDAVAMDTLQMQSIESRRELIAEIADKPLSEIADEIEGIL